MGDDDFSFEFEAQLDRKDRLLPAAAGPGSDQRALAVAPPPDLTGQQPGSYRKNFKKTVCTYWLRGMCMKGDACGFLHQYDVDRMPICRNLLRHGECRDLDCPYKHDTEEIKECNMYRLGFCIYGPQCRFRHRPLPGPPPAIEVVEAAKPKDFRDINRVVNAVNPGVVEERDRYRGPKRFGAGDGPADSGPGPDVKRPRALPWSGGIRPPAPAAPLALPAPPAAPPAAGAPAPARPPGGGPPPPGRPPALPGPAPPPGGPPVPPPRPPSDPPPAKPGVPPPRPPPGPPPPRPGPQPPPNPPPLQQQGGSGTNKDGAGLPGGGGLQGMGMPSVMGPGAMPGMMGGMPGMMVGGMGGPGMMPGFLPGQGMGMGMMPGAFMSGPPPGGMMMMGGQGQGGNGGAAGGMPPAKGVGAGPGMRMGTQF